MKPAQIEGMVEAIARVRRPVARTRAVLAGISGIDGSGKSTIAPRVVEGLRGRGLRTELILLDDWHNPKDVRFDPHRPAETFYEKGLRHKELFQKLVLPLQRERRVQLTATISRQPDEVPFQHTFRYENVDVVVFEGIFLFKKEFQQHFDFRCWVECPFEIALERALRRNQEGQTREGLIRDYETIYFAAQRLHFERDQPWQGVDFLFDNAAEATGGARETRTARAGSTAEH